jgi:hypothetical protein
VRLARIDDQLRGRRSVSGRIEFLALPERINGVGVALQIRVGVLAFLR